MSVSEVIVVVFLGLLTLAFAVWGFQVKEGKDAIVNMQKSIERIVDLKLATIQKEVSKTSASMDSLTNAINRLELNYEKRLALLEQANKYRSKSNVQ